MTNPRDDTVIHIHLKTPKSAAVAGIVFSLCWSPAHGSPPIRRRLRLH
jgi:hypothetical protein